MRVDLITRTPSDAQAASIAGKPKLWVQITGSDAEIDEPRLLIRKAIKAVRTGKAVGQRHDRTALKAIGLLAAASARAQAARRWSASDDYHPRADFGELLKAASRLRAVRGADDPVALLCNTLAENLSVFGGPA